MLGLVLTAGGARGAYQAGVLKRLGEIPSLRDAPSPFKIVTGASAGAINGVMIAGHSDSFGRATERLAALWAGLEADTVFRTDASSLSAGALAMLRDFALGGVLGRTVTQSIFDASPLHAMLARVLPMDGIGDAIRGRHLYACAVLATSYHSGRSFTFVQGARGHPVWMKSRRVVLPVRLTAEHVCASAAIPLVFQPVPVRCGGANVYFGDGALRLTTPFSPAIRLGSTRVFAIGVRSQKAADSLWQDEMGEIGETGQRSPSERTISCPPLSQISGVFLNAIFLDHLDSDLDHLRRMNEVLAAHVGVVPTAVARAAAAQPAVEPIRKITPLAVCPSEDLAVVAERFAHRMPRMVRYLLDGLGRPDAQSADLMSYLLFDSAYTRTLIDIGYEDAGARADELEAFLCADGRKRVARGKRTARTGTRPRCICSMRRCSKAIRTCRCSPTRASASRCSATAVG